MNGDFVDSNVFVYLFDETALQKHQVARSLIQAGLEEGTVSISHQVIQETLNVITRKLPVPATPDQARRFMDAVLLPLWRIMPSRELYHRALDIQSRYQYALYDALVVAAALEGGCARLYSEDLQDGQKIEGLVIKNPFER